MLEINNIYCGDCAIVMKDISNNSIDMVLTSPPYGNLRQYHGYTFDFPAIAKEIFRVLKPGGVAVWVVGDAVEKGTETGVSFQQTLYFKEVGFNLHDTMIYAKINPPPFPQNRYTQAFEYMFVLSKGKPKTFNPIRVQRIVPVTRKLSGTFRQQDGTLRKRNSFSPILCPLHTNIFWYSVGVEKKEKTSIKHNKDTHPARFPEKLAQDQILSWSAPGDIVLDPMAGSGVTCGVAKQNKRNYIGIDISEEYVEKMKWRLKRRYRAHLHTDVR